jgi:hypothetical protein
MLDVTVQPTPEAIAPPPLVGEQRVTLHHVTWEAYETILDESSRSEERLRT